MPEQNKKWYKRWWAITLVIFLTIILIFLVAFGFYIYNIAKKIKSQQASGNYNLAQILALQTQYENIEGENNYWLGSADPKLTIVEFADYDCSNCANSFSKIREISVKYKDNVKIIFRDFPIMSDDSFTLALAGRCAGEQGLFWPMHDRLFQKQGEFEIEDLAEIAKTVGVNTEKFSSCLNTEKYSEQVKKDYYEGVELGITGTPTWFFNGYKIAGDIPYGTFIELVEDFIN